MASTAGAGGPHGYEKLRLSIEVTAPEEEDASDQRQARVRAEGSNEQAQSARSEEDWKPFVRPLFGHSDRVKACCVFEVTAAQYNTLTEKTVWPEPGSKEEQAVKWLVERRGWGMDRIRRLFESLTEHPADPQAPLGTFSAADFEGMGDEDFKSFVTAMEDELSRQSASEAEDRLSLLSTVAASTPSDGTEALNKSLVLSCSDDDTLKLWDMETGRCMRTFYGHTQIVRGCSVIDREPENRPLVALSCSADRSLKIWDLATGLCLRTMGTSCQRDLDAIQKRAERLRTASGSRSKLSQSGGTRTTSPSSAYQYRQSDRYLQFENTPQAKLRRAKSKANAIAAISSTSEHNERHHTDWVMSCSFFECNGELRVLSASSDGTLKVWNVHGGNNEPLCTFGADQHGHDEKPPWIMGCYVFTRDDRVVAVSSSQDYKLRLWRLDAEWETGTDLLPECVFEGHNDWVNGCCAYLDENASGGRKWKVLSCCDDQTLKVWDASEDDGENAMCTSRAACHKPVKSDSRQRGCIGTLRGHTNVVISCCTFKHKRKIYGLSSAGDNTLRLWDLDSYRCLRTLRCTDGTRGCWVHSNQQSVTAVSCCGLHNIGDSHTVRLWDLRQVLEYVDNSKRIHPADIRAADVNTVKEWAEEIIISSHGHASLRGKLTTRRERRLLHVQIEDEETGTELGYGRVDVELNGGSDYQNGKIAQLNSTFAHGCLAIALTPIPGRYSVADQGDDLIRLIDMSKVYASESLTSLITKFVPIGEQWLHDVEQDGELPATSTAANLTQYSVAADALRWAEQIFASRTGSLQVPEDVDLRHKEFLKNLDQIELCEVFSGNKHKWRANNIQSTLAHFSNLIRRYEHKDEVIHARVLAWACIALVLSVSLTSEHDKSNEDKSSEDKSDKKKQLLNPTKRWIAAEMIRPADGGGGGGGREGSMSHNPHSFDCKILVKHFLDAFIVLQTDAECCRTELDELLNSRYAATLFTDYPALMASFVEHLPLRPQRNKEYLQIGGDRKRFVVVGTRSMHYRSENVSSRCCFYWRLRWCGCLCFYNGLFVGSSSVVVAPEGRITARNNTPAPWCGKRARQREQTVARYMVPLFGTGKYRRQDIDLLKRIVLETDASEPNMFRGEAIHAIVQYQWQSWVRRAYHFNFISYVLFTTMFVSMSMVKDNCICEMRHHGQREHCYEGEYMYSYNLDPDPDLDVDVAGDCTDLRSVWWSLWAQWLILLGYTAGVLILPLVCDITRRECCNRHAHVQWHGSQVWKRLLNVVMISTSLALVLLDQDNSKFHDLDATQGITALSCGSIIVSMLRGHTRFAFLVNMLEHIVDDIMTFLVVAGLAIVAFTIAFCLLLRDTDAEYEWDRPHEFQTLLEAAIAVVRLTLGDFGSKSSFHLSNARPLLTYSALLLFIFFVPIVLLNALIAIMNDTYERVKEQKDERLLLERARITLDMDSLWRSSPGLLLCCRCASRRHQHADTELRYLHVFKREVLDGTVDKVARHQDREDETRAASAVEFRRQHSTLLAKVNAVTASNSAPERGYATPPRTPRDNRALDEIKAQLGTLTAKISGLQHEPTILE